MNEPRLPLKVVEGKVRPPVNELAVNQGTCLSRNVPVCLGSSAGGDAESGCLSSFMAFDIEGASNEGDTYGWPYSDSGSVYRLASGGGIAGKDLSNSMLLDNFERDAGLRPVFLRRRAMSASWQSIQKMP